MFASAPIAGWPREPGLEPDAIRPGRETSAAPLGPIAAIVRRLPIAWVSATLALGLSHALAAPAATPPLPAAATAVPAQTLSLEAGTGRVMTLSSPMANIFVADPKIAEVRPASATSLFIFGVTTGRTTIAALDNDGHTLAQWDLMVEPQAYGAHQAQAMIARLIPGSHVQVQSQARGLILTGAVASPQDAAQAVAIAKGFSNDPQSIENELTVTTPIQVTLKVRIAEMSRTVVRNLGVNWQSIGSIGTIGTLPALTLNANASTITCAPAQGNFIPICPGGNFNALIDALAKDNLAHILAEPNLTVKSGQPASFQAGGEFPVPVSEANGAVSISFKSYGVLLSFLPTVLSDGRIDVHVKPEVSQIDKTTAVTVSAGNSQLVIPGISVRRAESSVELGSGESFAIAGLLQQTTQDNGQSIPGLGDTPFLGALFRDAAFQKQEEELVIIVTPYLVRPVVNSAVLHTPVDGYRTPSDIDRLLLMKQVSTTQPPVPVRIPGAAGFIVQ